MKPNLHITVADALRPRQISTHHPGEAVARMADVLVINKTDSAPPSDVELAEHGLRAINSRAVVVRAASPIRLDDASAVKGKRVLVVEDG
ncbi:MAG: GTP-binding protein, partial [Xanthobacteraceae bacterium]